MDAVEAPPAPALAPVPGRPLPRTPRELYDALPPLPGLQTEVIDDRLVTRLRDAPEYASAAMQLFEALLPLMDDRGWQAWAGNVGVCLDGTNEPVVPDLVLAPWGCPRD